MGQLLSTKREWSYILKSKEVVLVTEVDLERKRVTLLSPSPLPLPATTLLAGTLKWVSS